MDNDDFLEYCKEGDINAVEEFILNLNNSSTALISLISYKNYDALHRACYYCHYNIAKLLIDAVTKHTPKNLLEMISIFEYCSLQTSCEQGHYEIAKLLLDGEA